MAENRPFVWQMVKEAAHALPGPTLTYGEIRTYIRAHYSDVNPSTITCQIIVCCVNHPSRIHYPENKKPRSCNIAYDFLYSVGRGKVVLYDSNTHGSWAIGLNADGLLHVKQVIEMQEEDANVTKTPEKIIAFGLPTPCEKRVDDYLTQWDDLENYVLQENALQKLFLQTYPANTNIDEVLIKAAALNDFYSTNIYSIFPVAKHIVSLKIDERLHVGDPSLVNEIAHVVMQNGSEKNFYSFATKYCSHHRPECYSIYDRYIEKVLKHFRDANGFASFRLSDLKDYVSFKRILLEFQRYYGLGMYSLKDIDRYLWQLGKEHFPLEY